MLFVRNVEGSNLPEFLQFLSLWLLISIIFLVEQPHTVQNENCSLFNQR